MVSVAHTTRVMVKDDGTLSLRTDTAGLRVVTERISYSNLNLAGSNLDPAGTCHFLARRYHYYNIRIGHWLSVWMMKLSGIAGHGAGIPVRQYYKVAMSVHCHKLVPVQI